MPQNDTAQWFDLRSELLRALREGDYAPLRKFYDLHFPGIFRYVLCRVSGHHSDAEPIVGEVFHQAFRDLARFDGKHDPGAWLRGIARHRVLDFYRKERRRPVLELAFSQFDEEFSKYLTDLDSGELPDEMLERSDVSTVVETVLSDLPEQYERALRLRYLEGKPVKDIAELLEATPKAIEGRLSRARDAFREAFRLVARNLNYEGTTP